MLKFKHAARTGRFSDAIWRHLPSDLGEDPSRGIFKYEDFASFGLTTAVATNVGRYVGSAGCYKSYEDAGSISQVPTALGRLKIDIASTNNDEAWLQSCGGTGVLGKISSTSGKKLLFEARVASGQITGHNFFVGLTEEGLAAADTQADSGGAFASKDMIGFQINESTPTALDFVYRKAGQSLVTVEAGIQTIVADTFYNLGFVFDPDADPLERIKAYVNGVKVATMVTATNIAAATFPDGEELAFLIGGKNANAANVHYCEGWAFGQVF